MFLRWLYRNVHNMFRKEKKNTFIQIYIDHTGRQIDKKIDRQIDRKIERQANRKIKRRLF